MRAVSAASLKVTGLFGFSGMCVTTVAPLAALTCSATSVSSPKMLARTAGSKVRMVPVSSTWSGMML